MKFVLIAPALLLTLSSCADYQGGMGGRLAYNGYYDDSYGPIYDGYWGEGDTFYYRSSRNGEYQRDSGQHFRHDAGDQSAARDQNGQGGHYHQFSVRGPRNGGRHK